MKISKTDIFIAALIAAVVQTLIITSMMSSNLGGVMGGLTAGIFYLIYKDKIFPKNILRFNRGEMSNEV